jgi:hypothetical protein
MMEYIVVAIIVLACAAFLGKRFFGKKADACGGCNRCGSNKRCH